MAMIILMMIIIIVIIIAIIIMIIKIILIIAVVIIINSSFQPGDFSTGSTTGHCQLMWNYLRAKKVSKKELIQAIIEKLHDQ